MLLFGLWLRPLLYPKWKVTEMARAEHLNESNWTLYDVAWIAFGTD
jgi:hypothetical protein